MKSSVSNSRVYVCMCNKQNFDGFYFRKFRLPEVYENTSYQAEWYFLNILDSIACVESTIAWEDFQNVTEVCHKSQKLCPSHYDYYRVFDCEPYMLGYEKTNDISECMECASALYREKIRKDMEE